jgi:hypothetical protein
MHGTNVKIGKIAKEDDDDDDVNGTRNLTLRFKKSI